MISRWEEGKNLMKESERIPLGEHSLGYFDKLIFLSDYLLLLNISNHLSSLDEFVMKKSERI